MTDAAGASFDFAIRVYWEDTDAGGIVYHSNYLNFMERGRTEMLRALGLDQSELRVQEDVIFVVRRIGITYEQSAVLDDMLTVRTTVAALGGASLTLHQIVMRGDVALASAEVVIVCIKQGRAQRIPDSVRALLAAPPS